MSVLPEGYRFWVWPRYRLETPTVCVELTLCAGQVMALFLTNPHRNLSTPEIFEALYDSREDGGPVRGRRQIPVLVILLRQRLRAAGVDVVIESERGRSGYIFRGFATCEPEVGDTIRRYCSWPVNRPRPKAKEVPVIQPRSEGLVRAPQGNWYHNARYERAMITTPMSARD